MHKLFGRFRNKNEKILRRELAFAHTCIALLGLALIVLLTTIYRSLSGSNQILIFIVDVLLAFVVLISLSVVIYINKYTK